MDAIDTTDPRPFCWLVVPSLAMALLLGCGEGRGVVTGQVTLDGQPLAGGSDVSGIVQFYPTGNAGTPATGTLDAKGRYSLSAGSQASLQPGTYIVTVSATRIIPAASPGEAPSGRPITPRRYADPKQSGWQVKVKPGTNTFDFPMKSDE